MRKPIKNENKGLREWARNRMKELGVRHIDLVREFGVSRVYVSDFLQGRETLSVERTRQLFKILGTPDFIVDSTDSTLKDYKEEKKK